MTTTAAPPGSSPPSARLGSPWSSAPLTLATLVVMLVAVALREGSGGGFTSPGWPLLAFTVLAWLPLTVRTRWPLPVLAATVVVHAAQLLLLPQIDPGLTTQGMGAYQPVPVATMVAAFTAAVRVPRRTAWRAGVVASLLLPLAAIIGQPDDQLLTDLVMCNLVLDGTALGALVAGRRDRLSQEARQRAEDTRRAVEAERLRIAAELHDVLAHHLTLVNAQVGVAGYLLSSDPQAAGTALEGLAEHTRQALDELRATVGLLRRDDADGHDTGRSPVPGLDRLPDLLAAVRAAGTAVEIRTDGDPRSLPAAGDHAAYRIVQESLTNATKHAPGTRVTLLLDWTDGAVLRLRVDNAPPPRPSSPGPGTSHGLIGMSERARAAGGTVTAGPAPDGGYVVTAALPTATPEKP